MNQEAEAEAAEAAEEAEAELEYVGQYTIENTKGVEVYYISLTEDLNRDTLVVTTSLEAARNYCRNLEGTPAAEAVEASTEIVDFEKGKAEAEAESTTGGVNEVP